MLYIYIYIYVFVYVCLLEVCLEGGGQLVVLRPGPPKYNYLKSSEVPILLLIFLWKFGIVKKYSERNCEFLRKRACNLLWILTSTPK